MENKKLQLRLALLSSLHHLPYITSRLIQEESHALAAEILAHDVELDVVLVDHVCDTKHNVSCTMLCTIEIRRSQLTPTLHQ